MRALRYVADFARSAWRNEDAREAVKVFFGAVFLVGFLVALVLIVGLLGHLLLGVATWLGVVSLVVLTSIAVVVLVGVIVELGDRF